jgi:hypothetical protein
MATLNIKVSRNGIDKISADTCTISDINEASELIRATSVASRLLHDGVIEYFSGESPLVEEPEVLLPTFEGGLRDLPRKLKIFVGNGPRDPFTDPPDWFIDSLKKAFPNDFMWDNAAEDLPGGEGEAAVMVFKAQIPKPDGWLDHWGFCGVGHDDNGCAGKDLLISEPYGISLQQITDLALFFEKVGWTFNIVGKSAHHPSATIRIEIRPKK